MPTIIFIYKISSIFFALTLTLNVLAYYRGKLYLSEQRVAGLKYKDGSLMFTNTLTGNIFAGNATDHAFKNNNHMNVFNYVSSFPTPATNTIEYVSSFVYGYTDNYQYVQRCLQLDTDENIPDIYLLYGYTVMMRNVTGLRGTLCQEKFNDPGAYAQIDSLCSGSNIACVRDQLFIGCIQEKELFVYYVDDCGRLNALEPNVHWSTYNGTIVFDDDPAMVENYYTLHTHKI